MSIDSGLLEIYLTFGILVGTLYFAAFASLVFKASGVLGISRRSNGAYAVVWAVIAMLPLSSNHVAEPSVLAWAVLGVLFARAEQAHSRIWSSPLKSVGYASGLRATARPYPYQAEKMT